MYQDIIITIDKQHIMINGIEVTNDNYNDVFDTVGLDIGTCIKLIKFLKNVKRVKK